MKDLNMGEHFIGRKINKKTFVGAP